MIKPGMVWHWSCKCHDCVSKDTTIELFAEEGLSDGYCEPQMKMFCKERGHHYPVCTKRVPDERETEDF